MLLIPKAKARIKYWKKIIRIQNKSVLAGRGKTSPGIKLPFIKKGSRKWQIIMELARMTTPELLEVAKEYYYDLKKIRSLLKHYERGTERQEKKREGRKYITITVGFPPRSRYLAHLIRYQIINHERGMIHLSKVKEG